MPPEYHSIKVFMVISFPYVYAFLAKTYRGPPYTSSFCMPACSWLAVSHVLFVDKLGVLCLVLPLGVFGRPACHISIIVALWRSSYGCLGSEAKGLRFEWLRSTEASCSCLRAFSFLFYLLLELTAAGNNGFQYACLPGMPMGESFLLGVRVLLPLVAVPRQCSGTFLGAACSNTSG